MTFRETNDGIIGLALAVARLVTAKLHFDMELDGDHSTWVDNARFFASTPSTRDWCFAPLEHTMGPETPTII